MKKALSRKQRVMRNRRIALSVLMGITILVIFLLVIRKEPETVEEAPVYVSEDTATEDAEEEAAMEKEVFHRETIMEPEPEDVKETSIKDDTKDAPSLSENTRESEPASDETEESDFSDADETEYGYYGDDDNDYDDDEADEEEDFGLEFFEEDEEKEW